MSLVKGNGAGDQSTGFYSTTIDQSLRFEDGDSPYLLRTPSSSGNRKTWTISCWFKIGNLDLTANIISVFQSASPNQQVVIRFYQNKLYLYDFGGAYLISTNRVFRDTTNWTHMVWRFDSTQSTDSERIKLYINGTQETDLNDESYPSQDHDSLWNHTNKHLIGARTDNATPTPIQEFDGYLAEFNLVDGQALGPESFGETKNTVWVPKNVSGISYGTNGFRLTFADSSALGDDTSGNGNDFTSSGLAATDVVLDTPTTNFATSLGAGLAEPVDYQSYNTPTSSQGNLKVTGNNLGWTNGSSNFGMTSGKWYAELIVNSWVSSIYVRIGLRARPARTYDEYFVLGNGTGQLDGTTRNGRLPSFTTGDVIQFALDLENNAFYLGKNNTWGNSATATEIANGTTTNAFASGSEVPTGDGHTYFFYAQPHSTGTSLTWNFGQDSSFAGAKTAQGNSDSGSSNTDFFYTPPDGFLACNTTNIPELTISPAQSSQADDHFNTITYTGNDASTRSLTGVGFRPDWIWYKHRSIGYGHVTYDSSRSDGSVSNNVYTITSGENREKHLRVDNTLQEGGYDDLYGTLTSFDADGITIARGDASGTESAFFNNNSSTVVGWNWKVNGGTTSTNSDGNEDSTVQVNSDAGISIVLWTGGSNVQTHTFGHGLGAKPAMIIHKRRSSTSNWSIWHQLVSSPNDNYLIWDTTAAANGSTSWEQPTSTVFQPYIGSSGENWVSYVFKEVEGYSRFGGYKGNGSTDGPFAYTGFRPAFLMIKKTSGTGNWCVFDNKRNPTNAVNLMMLADTADNESAGGTGDNLDFLSNGFKIRDNSSGRNGNGATYIYMAFAEQPFKFSNAK